MTGSPPPGGATYRDAGVDIEAGDALVERIKPLARATARPGAMGGLGGFGALFDLRAAGFRDPVLVSSTDGAKGCAPSTCGQATRSSRSAARRYSTR